MIAIMLKAEGKSSSTELKNVFWDKFLTFFNHSFRVLVLDTVTFLLGTRAH